MERGIRQVKSNGLPVWLVIFPEGTRYNSIQNPSALGRSKTFAEQKGFFSFSFPFVTGRFVFRCSTVRTRSLPSIRCDGGVDQRPERSVRRHLRYHGDLRPNERSETSASSCSAFDGRSDLLSPPSGSKKHFCRSFAFRILQTFATGNSHPFGTNSDRFSSESDERRDFHLALPTLREERRVTIGRTSAMRKTILGGCFSLLNEFYESSSSEEKFAAETNVDELKLSETLPSLFLFVFTTFCLLLSPTGRMIYFLICVFGSLLGFAWIHFFPTRR